MMVEKVDMSEVGERPMTHREWLESLSDEDLAAWLCDNYYVQEPHLLYPDITVRYTTGLTAIKGRYSYSEYGLTGWFKEEHNGDSCTL